MVIMISEHKYLMTLPTSQGCQKDYKGHSVNIGIMLKEQRRVLLILASGIPEGFLEEATLWSGLEG